MVKRKNVETLESVLARPWCYYCDRHFDDLRILTEHQKHKHFQCLSQNCSRRLNTAGGLRVHMQQVHKEELKEVDNVPDNLAARRDPNIEIFGMTGVPDHILKAREDTIREQFAKREYEWRILTGNPLPGTETPEQAQAPKRVKVESKEDLKRRVQELKAKRAAEKAARESGIPIPAAATSPANPSGTLSSPATPSDPAREATLTPPAATHYLPPGQALPPYNLGYPPVNYGLPAYSPAVYGYNGAPPGLAMSANTPHPLPFHTAPPGFSNLPNGYHPHALPTHPQAPNGAGTMSPGAQVDHRQPSNQTTTSYQKTPMNVAPLGFEAAFEGLMDRAQAALQDNTLEDPDHKKSNDAPKASANDNKSGDHKNKQLRDCKLSDNIVSWEEKRASAPRYRKFTTPAVERTTGPLTANVTGTVDGA